MNQTTQETNATRIDRALSILGLRRFECRSSYDLPNAQRNLSGLSHWADSDTLKGFKSRILFARHRHNGLLFLAIESNGTKPMEPKKNKRFAVFDVFGDMVSDRDLWFATTAQAEKAASAFIESFDAETHTLAKIAKRAERMAKEAAELAAIVKS